MLPGIKQKIEYFKTHKFVRNTAILQAGSMAGNVLQAGAGIIMARILQPETFGIYALSFSLAGILSIFLGVGAQDAVITILSGAYARKDAEEISSALAFLAKMTVIVSLVGLVGAVSAPFIAQFAYGNMNIGFYAAVVVIASIVSTTAYSFATIGLQIVGRIQTMTLLGLTDQLTRTGFALSLVALGFGVPGIVFGHLTGAITVFVFSVVAWKKLQKDFIILPHIRKLLRTMWAAPVRQYLRFSFWIAVDRNLSNLYNILPILMTGVFLVPAEVTFFKLAFGYINLALGFLGPIGILLNVEFPKMREHGIERLSRNFTRVSLYGLGISTVLTLAAVAVAPIAFKILYGPTFADTIPYVYGLIPYGVLMGIGIGLGSILRAIKKVNISIWVNVLNLAMGIPLALLLISKFGAWGTIAIVTAWYTIAHMAVFFYVRRYLKIQLEAQYADFPN